MLGIKSDDGGVLTPSFTCADTFEVVCMFDVFGLFLPFQPSFVRRGDVCTEYPGKLAQKARAGMSKVESSSLSYSHVFAVSTLSSNASYQVSINPVGAIVSVVSLLLSVWCISFKVFV